MKSLCVQNNLSDLEVFYSDFRNAVNLFQQLITIMEKYFCIIDTEVKTDHNIKQQLHIIPLHPLWIILKLPILCEKTKT